MNRIQYKLIFYITFVWTTYSIVQAQQAKGPILQIQTNPTDFDTTYCKITKCKTITFRNIGDTVLNVTSVEQTRDPFQANMPSAFSLQKNESRVFDLCYHPNTAPVVDSQRIKFIADNRVSLSIGVLFDVSESMNEMDIYDSIKKDFVTRISAAHTAGTDFFNGLLNTTDIQDEASVSSFASYNAFSNDQSFTNNIVLLKNAVPIATKGSPLGNNTCLFSALTRTISQLQVRTKKRVLIVLTDGNENCDASSPSSDEVIQTAKSAGIIIFTIGIGTADPTILTQIANATGGRFFTATNQSDLIAVYRTVATLMSQNVEGSISMRGKGVTSSPMLNPPILNFDSLQVGKLKCLSCILRNIGNGPLNITSISTPNLPFTIKNQPNGDTLTFCFSPSDLQTKSSQVTINTNSCITPTVTLSLRGSGYDYVTLICDTMMSGKPGSVVSVPILLHEMLPQNYNVSSIKIIMRYNKTMLYPVSQPINTTNTVTQSMNDLSYSTDYDILNATTTFTLRGSVISNQQSNAVLVKFNFLVLHGNALTTPIKLVSAAFADGNPRVNVESSSIFIADSLCNQDQRLIDASVRIENKLGQNTPNPISLQNPVTKIRFSIAESNWTRLMVYDALGREVTRLVDEWKNSGEFEVTFYTIQYPSGLYFYRIESGTFSDLKKMFLMK